MTQTGCGSGQWSGGAAPLGSTGQGSEVCGVWPQRSSSPQAVALMEDLSWCPTGPSLLPILVLWEDNAALLDYFCLNTFRWMFTFFLSYIKKDSPLSKDFRQSKGQCKKIVFDVMNINCLIKVTVDFPLFNFFAHPLLLLIPGRFFFSFFTERGNLFWVQGEPLALWLGPGGSWGRNRLNFSTLICQSFKILLLLRAAGFPSLPHPVPPPNLF